MREPDLLAELRAADIRVWADGDRLQCDAPAGTLTPERREQLARHKQELLAFLRGPAELSFAQQRLWFLDQFEPGSAVYVMPVALRMQGSLDVRALEQALGTIVARHESLRTVFASTEDGPVQVVAEPGEWSLPVVDLSVAPEQLTTRMGQETARGFALDKGPLFRAVLYRLGAVEHVLLMLQHHIVSDGWSVSVVASELGVLYRAYARGHQPELPRLPIQYRDVARWERTPTHEEALERQLAYWRGRLSGAPQVLELPTDRPRPLVETHRGAQHFFLIPREVSEQLAAFTRREGVTVFMTLLAAFDVLLWRYTGQEDLLVGTPVANRGRTELEGLIGLFVNTLVLRTELAGDPAVRELLRRVRDTCLGAYANQELPFERLVEELHPARDLSRNPLFQVMLVFRSLPPGGLLDLPGLSATPVDVDRGKSQFDLTLSLAEADGALAATLEYSTDLFAPATVERLGEQFVELLRAMAAHPERPIGALDILPPSERRRLLVEWSTTAAPPPEDTCVHRLFEAQVAETPEATAVVFEDEVLTYAELNARANQLAHALITLGVAPDAPVAIALERSPAMIVALLATLKAGGAYVPLDPAYPAERLAFMLADSGARILLTQEALRPRLPATAAHTLCLDAAAASIGRQPRRNPDRPVAPEHLAYVIYTSGSTGQPKGVAVEHRSVAHHSLVMRSCFELTARDRFLQFASFSFDASVEQILPALCAGAAVALPAPGLLSPESVDACLQRHGVTVLEFTPAFFRVWSESFEARRYPLVRLIILAGEALPTEMLAVRARWPKPGPRFLNAYGPTESTVSTTLYEIPESLSGTSVPMGRPLPQRSVYVLDGRGQPTPIGVPGELHIGGIGLARGYLNRPQLTAERFIPDPFSGVPGTRLYKSGDLVRYRADGNLEFLGRLDHQVKIRGFRIELGEIEAALRDCPGVEQAVVVAQEVAGEDRRLVAFLIAGTAAPAGATALRTRLGARLPQHMVPSSFVFLDALPLTPNRKVDRKALATMDVRDTSPRADSVAPRTATEERVASIWAEVLHAPSPGIHDNFFDAGGHSLTAALLVARIRSAFDVDVGLRSLFERPTVAGLAEVADVLVLSRGRDASATTPADHEEFEV